MHRLEEDLGFLLAKTHRAMRRWLVPQLGPLGVTYEQFKVLNALCEEDDLSQNDLAGRVTTDKTSLARTLVRMEKAGLICRVPDTADSRIRRVSPTRIGREIQAQIVTLREAGLGKAVQGLTSKEVVALKRLLRKVCDNMDC